MVLLPVFGQDQSEQAGFPIIAQQVVHAVAREGNPLQVALRGFPSTIPKTSSSEVDEGGRKREVEELGVGKPLSPVPASRSTRGRRAARQGRAETCRADGPGELAGASGWRGLGWRVAHAQAVAAAVGARDARGAIASVDLAGGGKGGPTVKEEGGGAGAARDDAVQPGRWNGRRPGLGRVVDSGPLGRSEEQAPEGFGAAGLPGGEKKWKEQCAKHARRSGQVRMHTRTNLA